MSVDKWLTVRLPLADHKALTDLAKRNERTIAAEIRLAIRERLEATTLEPEAKGV